MRSLVDGQLQTLSQVQPEPAQTTGDQVRTVGPVDRNLLGGKYHLAGARAGHDEDQLARVAGRGHGPQCGRRFRQWLDEDPALPAADIEAVHESGITFPQFTQADSGIEQR